MPGPQQDDASARALPKGVPPRAAFLLIAPTEADALSLAALAGAVHLPAWGSRPLSERDPAAASQGRRLAAIAEIDRSKRPRVVCGPEGVAAAIPEAGLAARTLDLAPGTAATGLPERLAALGYGADDRADAPGLMSLAGAALDLWPSNRDGPVRLRLADGAIETIVAIDPATLLSGEAIDALAVPPAVTHLRDGKEPGEAEEWPAAWERRSALDLVGKARVLVAPGAAERVRALLEEADREWEERRVEGDGAVARRAWLSAGEWEAIEQRAKSVELGDLPPPPPLPVAAEMGEEPLSAGDRVVHPAHGLGLFRGIETMEVDGHLRDVLRIEFADGELGVPAAEAGAVWRHSGGAENEPGEGGSGGDAETDGPAADRMGGEAWGRAAAELAREMRETADELRAARAALERARAPRIGWDGPLLKRAAGNWHVPTPDQDAAFADLAADMGGEPGADTERHGAVVRPPMDRLLCGDVGTGKTEAILRAAVAAVESGHQALIAAPTLLLAAQHAATFRERLDPLDVPVRLLDGTTPDGEAEQTLRRLRDGEPLIVIGTHRLAGEDVAPDRPGLLVLDEEQRFGAALKSELRARMGGAHVLATTATPIPRTQMAALAGLRSVSVLRAAPPGRGARRTEVRRWDEGLLARALQSESRAGGRAFVVVPRIADMDAVADGLSRGSPDLRVACLHGQMDEGEGRAALDEFRRGRADVLVATAVIETGIDVPEASLMAILGAGAFGLSQIHQLRGRVGRGSRAGRAMLFAECGWTGAEAFEASAARLALLERYDGPGAGFALAARDLEQRGAGELFGERQTGHLKRLGAPLYARLLRDVLDAARADADLDAQFDTLGDPAALVLPGAILPDDYVPHPDVRARLYVRLGRARSAAEVDALLDEIADRFGPPPGPAERFVAAARLSARARAAGAREIATGPEAVAIGFGSGTAARLRKRVGGKAVTWRDDRLVFRSLKPEPERTALAIDAIERALAEAEAGDDAENATGKAA